MTPIASKNAAMHGSTKILRFVAVKYIATTEKKESAMIAKQAFPIWKGLGMGHKTLHIVAL
jgi:hypothetical protein